MLVGASVSGSELSGFLSDSLALIRGPPSDTAAEECFSSFGPFFELPFRLSLLVKTGSLSSAVVVAVNTLLCSPLLISSPSISLLFLHVTIARVELARSNKLNRTDKAATASMKLSIKVFSVRLEM